MSKLEELIREMCPHGVEYKTLEECVQKIGKIKWEKTDESYFYIDLTSVDRDIHKITNPQIIDANNAPDRAKQIVLKEDVLFATTRPMLKRFCMIDDKYDGQICSTGFCVLRANPQLVLPRWLFFIISSSEFYSYVKVNQKEGSYPAILDKKVKQFQIPVPPLPVQCEIVRILDNFTELTAELTAELAARKKQYAYYRDKLFATTDRIEYKTLSQISENCDKQRKPVTKEKRKAGKYPYYGASGIVDYVDDYIFEGEYLLISEDGANLLARNTPIAFSISGKNWVNNHAHVLKFKHKETQRYVEFYLGYVTTNS